MAKKKYIIVINEPVTEKEVETFAKAIASNYPNVKGGENLFLILSDNSNENAKDIYSKIATKISNSVSFLVVDFGYWYGKLPGEVFEWLAEKFPNENLLRE